MEVNVMTFNTLAHSHSNTLPLACAFYFVSRLLLSALSAEAQISTSKLPTTAAVVAG